MNRKLKTMIDRDAVNTRALAMWMPISRLVDFRNKTVMDLGYGGGDFIYKAHIAGASKVTGIDLSSGTKSVEVNVQHTKYGVKSAGTIETIKGDLNLMKTEWAADISFCFSVLPYLDDPQNFVNWMSNQFKLSVIECQYKGDGPGFGFIKDTADMKYWLKNSFDNVTLIGNSYVVSRDTYRDIWMCENDL